MKSTIDQLVNRGMIADICIDDYMNLSLADLLLMLESKKAVERSIAARVIGINQNIAAIEALINSLKKEKKLYTKIEICNAFVLFGTSALNFLIPLLGTIGNNQHKSVPDGGFNKKSFPLPRDIVSRILIRIGKDALPSLQQLLISGGETQISEAIDAIGHISFYDKDKSSLKSLMDCYEKYRDNLLIVWKIVRTLSAFPESVNFLNNLIMNITYSSINKEIKRSIKIITLNNNELPCKRR